MNMKTSLLCHSLLIALGLSASATVMAQHDHSQHATQAEAPKPAATDPHADHAGHGNHAQMDHSQMRHDAMDHRGMEHGDMKHSNMEHGNADTQKPAMDHSKMDHAHDMHATQASPTPAVLDHASMDHGAMGHGAHAAMEMPREPIPTLTDADRAAAFPVLHTHDMSHGQSIHSLVLFNRLEAWDADPGTGQAWEAQAWVGGDIHRLWLRSEGERQRGSTESANLEVLYGRSVSTWWDVVTGIRHDFSPGSSQTWAALGVQGMAPYKFEVSATAYLGESGQVAAEVEVEYELLLTNRLILQPLVGLSFNSRNDPARHVGAGLGKAEAGLRLRYELSNRRFAPYLGISHERLFGRTADFHRAETGGVRDTRVLAGLRFWF